MPGFRHASPSACRPARPIGSFIATCMRCISASPAVSAAGRILLAGDAAHVNNPIGGMGMNSGFQDGLNLADKLTQIWQGADPIRLLDRYDRQRRLTAVEYVQAQSIANKRALEEREPGKRREILDQSAPHRRRSETASRTRPAQFADRDAAERRSDRVIERPGLRGRPTAILIFPIWNSPSPADRAAASRRCRRAAGSRQHDC